MTGLLKPGEFTGLAKNYSLYRPDYCPSVLDGLLGLMDKPVSELDAADVGAGTGIWSRQVFRQGVRSLTAVEPNEDMRFHGEADSQGLPIQWLEGSAENVPLNDNSCDWLSMASSFHWADFDRATAEFHRVLRPGGRFVAIWNPRLIEVNPLLVEIEDYLKSLKPDLKRKSSGRSGITEGLTQRLWDSPYFNDVVYLEGRHVIEMSPESYIGVWKSVNDLRVQLGEAGFARFLAFVEERIQDETMISATYLTRAWSARNRGQ